MECLSERDNPKDGEERDQKRKERDGEVLREGEMEWGEREIERERRERERERGEHRK